MDSRMPDYRSGRGVSRFSSPRFESGDVDATGGWFAAVVLVTVLAAFMIVYRSGNSDLQTASNSLVMHGSAQPAPLGPPRIVL